MVKHVRTNLTSSGVGDPHIFPVSSLALDSKLYGDEAKLQESGFPVFEDALSRFAVEESPRLSERAGYDELASVRDRIRAWADMAPRMRPRVSVKSWSWKRFTHEPYPVLRL